jgi:ribosome maturation factor RimP
MSNLHDDIKAICESAGVALYDIETAREFDEDIFRVYIISKDGISVDKCTEVSRLLSPLLDVHPPMHGEYRLEVSSPGIERALKKPEHYIHSVGQKIRVTTKEGDKLIGELLEANENEFILKTDGEEIVFEYPQVKKTRTYFEW